MKEVIDRLKIVFHSDFFSLSVHFMEEIGEIASYVIRGQDIKPRVDGKNESIYLMSEIMKHLSEFSLEEVEKINQYSEFYRWNRKFTKEKFDEKIEKELIDMVMEVGLYVMLLSIKKYKSPNIEKIYSYKFDKDQDFKSSERYAFLDITMNLWILFKKSLSIDNQNPNIDVYSELKSLLDDIVDLCNIYNIDINSGINRKLNIELREEKRSKE